MLKFHHISIVLYLTAFLYSLPTAISSNYELKWQDEFDGSVFDTTKWDYRLLGPRRIAVQVKEAVKTDGAGHLFITASKVGTEYHTGMISSFGKYETTYGYFECRAKLGRASGPWSAFWISDTSVKHEDIDYTKNGTEIDIYEYFQYKKDQVQHNLHWGGYTTLHQTVGHTRTQNNLDTGWHTFGVEWTETAYKFYVDDVLSWTTTSAISPIAEYMILSVEMDSWSGLIPSQLPDTTFWDYVRVYKRKDTLSTDTLTTIPPSDTDHVRWLKPAADGSVRGGSYATVNYGAVGLYVKGSPDVGYARETYLRFDLSGIPFSKLASAKLNMNLFSTDLISPLTFHAYSVQENSWTEMGLNWNNKPPLRKSIASAIIDTPINQYNSWDLTTFVDSVFNSSKIFTICIRDTSKTDRLAIFRSRESIGGYPYLELISDDAHVSSSKPIREQTQSPLLKAAPNPFTETVSIKLSNLYKARIEIFNSNGKYVSHCTTNNGKYYWNASNMPAGVYLVRAVSGSAVIVKKLLLTR